MSQEPDVADLIGQESFVIPSAPLEAASFERELDQQEERVTERADSETEALSAQIPAGGAPDSADSVAALAQVSDAEGPASNGMQEQLEMDLPDGIPDPIRDGRMSLPEFPEGMDMEHSAANEPPDILPAFDTPDVMNPDGTPVVNNLFADEMLEPEVPTEARILMGDRDVESVPAQRPAPRSARSEMPSVAASVAASAAASLSSGAGAGAPTSDPLRVRDPKPSIQADVIDSARVITPVAAVGSDSSATEGTKKHDNLVFEYGPLTGFAHQIGNLIDQNAVSATGAMKLRDTVNRLISVAVQENPTELFDEDGVPFPANTEMGLNGRQMVLSKLRDGLKKGLPLGEDGEWEVQSSNTSLVKLVESAVDGEIKRVSESMKLLAVPTLAQSVVGGVANMFKGFTHNGEKAGDVREFRNHQLNESLAFLERTAKDFKQNAGDAGWMAENGASAMHSARQHRDRIGDLASELSGRLDQGIFSKRLKGISEAFGEAETTSNDEKSKKELAQMIESITEMMTKLADKVKNMFQSVRKPQP